MTKLLGTVLVVLLVGGCGGSDDPNIPADDQRQIDTLGDQQDCDGLQTIFDAADTSNDTDRMRYVDKVMKAAGCYG